TPVYDPSDLIGGRLYATNNQLESEYQGGVNAVLEYDLSASNHLMAGYWFDRWDVNEVAYNNLLNPSGLVSGIGANFALRDATGSLVTGTNWVNGTTTHQFFVGDTQAFFDNRLQISAGAKDLIYDVSGHNNIPGNQNGFGAHITKLEPRASFSFNATDQIQLYGNVITNVRVPISPATYIDTYNQSTGKKASVGNLSALPETSTGEQ